MADRSEPPYDPYIPANGSQKPQDGNQRTAALQAVSIPNLLQRNMRFCGMEPGDIVTICNDQQWWPPMCIHTLQTTINDLRPPSERHQSITAHVSLVQWSSDAMDVSQATIDE